MAAPPSGHEAKGRRSPSPPGPSDEMINRFGPDFTCLYVNEACARIYQTTPQEMIGRNWLPFVPGDQREQVRALIEGLTPEHPMVSIEHPVVLHTGEVRWQHWVNCALFDAQGRVLEYQAVGRDITEQRQAEERLRLAMAAADAGAWTWDARTGQSSWDDRYHAMYGFAPGQPRTYDTWVASLHPDDRPRVLARLDEMLRTPGDDDWDMQFRALRPDGQVVWMHGLGRAERDARGQVVRLAGINLDITERQRAEEALHESRERLRVQLQHMPIACILHDAEGRFVDWNPAAERIFGYTAAEALGHTCDLIVPPAARGHVHDVLRRTLAGEALPPSSNENLTKDGRTIRCRWINTPIADAQGRITGLLSMAEDITERVQARQALLQTREDMDRAQAVSHTGSWRLDLTTNLLQWSKETWRIFALPEGTPLSYEAFLNAVHPDDLARVRERWSAALRGEANDVEFRILAAGAVKWVRARSSLELGPDGTPRAAFGTVQDITDRKQADEALRRSEQRYRALAETAHDLIYIIGRDDRVEYVNSFAAAHLRRSPQEVVGQPRAALFPPEAAARQARNLQHVLATGEPTQAEDRVPFPGGDLWLHTSLTPLRNEAGEIVSVLGISRDITGRKRIEEALQASERKFRDLAEGMPDGASLVVDGKFVWVNPAYCRMFGYREEELLGQSIEKTIAPEMRQAMMQRLAYRLEGKSVPTQYEAVGLRKDGTRFDLENSVKVVDVGGRPGVQSVMRDITERKRAERALAQSEKKYRDLIETTGTGFVIVDPQGRVLDANARYVSLTGHERRQEILGRCVTEWTAPDEVELNRAAVRRCFEQGSIRGFVVHYVDRSGKRTPIEIHATVVPGPDGPQILTLCHDITERKRIEDALRASEERYRAVTEHALDCIFCKDTERRYTFCNPAVLRLLGRTADEVLGKTAEDVLPPEGAQLIREPDEATLRGETINRIGTLRLGSDERVFHTVQVPLRDAQGRVVGLTGISRDITERRRAEEALRASEERYRAITENAADAIFCKDTERRYTFVNPVGLRIIGRRAEEVLGKTPEELFDPGDAATIRDVDDACLRGEIVNAVRTLHRGDREFVLHTVQAPLRDQAGQVVGITGIVRDLTGQRRLADDLRASEAAYHTIFDAVTDAILLLDPETGTILEMNAAARSYARRLGRPPSAPLALALLASHEEPFTEKEALRRVHAAARGRPQSYEWMLRDPHGHPTWFLVNLTAANIRGTRCVLAVARETTELRRAQDERLRIQKLESLGLLAGGIAHDFNNLLMGILASIALARLDHGTSPEAARTLDDAEKAVRRATGLTHQLLTFSRGGAPVRRAIALCELVRETAEFALTGSNVRAHFAIAPDLWPAEVDAAQIGQVIQNLVINANEAMPDGGVVRITVANLLLGAESGIPLPPGRYVKVAVRDTGVGIAPENLQRIFDPYFTTKGAGSGLGLAVAYSVLRSHGGHIRVESQLGAGSTFEVFLPAATAAAEPAAPSAAAARRQGRLLVMDDDQVIRRCLEQLLERVGYTVACASDGAEAVKMFREALERGQPFDAVVLDLTVVAGMGGEACLERLRELDPDVRAIVASGFHTDPVMAEFRERGFRAVVAKPFSLEELLRALDEARA